MPLPAWPGPLEGISIFDDKGNTLDTSMSNAAAGSLFLDPVEGATFRLTALGRDGQMDQATVTIAPRPDPPAIVEFATPTPEVASGDTVTLRWITNGGASVEIVDDMGTMVDISTKSVDVDTVDVVITRNTTFTFTVTNPAGSVSRNLTVNIGNPVMATCAANRTGSRRRPDAVAPCGKEKDSLWMDSAFSLRPLHSG